MKYYLSLQANSPLTCASVFDRFARSATCSRGENRSSFTDDGLSTLLSLPSIKVLELTCCDSSVTAAPLEVFLEELSAKDAAPRTLEELKIAPARLLEALQRRKTMSFISSYNNQPLSYTLTKFKANPLT